MADATAAAAASPVASDALPESVVAEADAPAPELAVAEAASATPESAAEVDVLARSLAEAGLVNGVRERRKDWARLAALLLETLKGQTPRDASAAAGDKDRASLDRACDILTRIAASQLTQKLVQELVRLLAEKGVVSELVGEVVVASLQTIAATAQKREPRRKRPREETSGEKGEEPASL